MIVDFIGEILGQIFIEIIFNKIIRPLLKIIGSLVRWTFCFGKTPFNDILKKDYNTRIGLIITLLIVFVLIFFLQ